MGVLVIYFLEAVQVQSNQCQGLNVAPRAIEFFLECLSEESAIVESCQRIGHGTELEFLQVVVLDEDGDAQETRRGENIRERGFQRNLTTEKSGKLSPANEHLIPDLHTFVFAQIEVSDRTEISLWKLAARRQIEAFERIG